jgi:hypothetical protein
MVDITREKCLRAGVDVTVRQLAIEDLGDPAVRRELGRFDLILSDFDGINCLRDITPLADWFGDLLNPGGDVVLVYMNPICVMEALYFLLRGNPRRALARLNRGGSQANIGKGATIRTYFHPVRRLRHAFARRYRIRHIAAIGLTTPPTLMRDFYHRHARLFAALDPIENLLSPLPPFNRIGDHVLVHAQLRRA